MRGHTLSNSFSVVGILNAGNWVSLQSSVQDRGAVVDVGVRAVKGANFRGGATFSRRRAIVCAPPYHERKLAINTRISRNDANLTR
jgi:hypothetical protein